MTYCLAIALKAGLVFASDSRTSAGMDQASTYSKMHRFGEEGQRQIVLLTSGNLATTQGVIAQVGRDIKENAEVNLLNVPSLSEAADYVGRLSRAQQERHAGEGTSFEASFVMGGQIRASEPAVYLIYPQGNYITTSDDTPYLQIGESKYGKPILDRILRPDTSLETAALCALVSMDSTMRSNLTVGPPLELLVYERESFHLRQYHRFTEDSEYLRELKRSWDAKLKEAFRQLPPIAWAFSWDHSPDGEQSEAL